MIKCTHPSLLSYLITDVVTTLVGFRNDIAHTTVFLLLPKARKKLVKGRVSGGLLNDHSKALEWIMLDPFNAKLHTQNIASYI